jgi:hypothetical protein
MPDTSEADRTAGRDHPERDALRAVGAVGSAAASSP